MRRSQPLRSALREAAAARRASCPHRSFHSRAPLAVRISSTPTAPSPGLEGGLPLSTSTPELGLDSPDARFEVLGSPSSLLSVSLSASQNLYTRRGTLVAVTGQAENAVSTLSVLEPFRRALLRIPFLYQRVSSTSPITALIATKSPLTSFAVVHLDGTVDWMVAQRKALLAWTGHTMSVRPTINRKLSLAHWGNSEIVGRGLLALAGQGQVYQVTLQQGEEFVAHPSNVVAYTITQHPPLPYRLKSSSLRLQIPDFGLSAWIPDTKFFRVMRESETWKFLRSLSFTFRTWSRRTIWGDRLFLQFRGPTTILLQSRAARLNDVLTTRDVNEIADTAPGVISPAVTLERKRDSAEKDKEGSVKKPRADVPTSISVASVGPDGKVAFKDADDFKEIGGR